MIAVSEVYTPPRVWEILVGGSEDADERVDVEMGMVRLPLEERTFIWLLAQGYTGLAAQELSGIEGNQTRLRREILIKLSAIINGG
jgi:hypothetical protein